MLKSGPYALNGIGRTIIIECNGHHLHPSLRPDDYPGHVPDLRLLPLHGGPDLYLALLIFIPDLFSGGGAKAPAQPLLKVESLLQEKQGAYIAFAVAGLFTAVKFWPLLKTDLGRSGMWPAGLRSGQPHWYQRRAFTANNHGA
jgi:hypothetical protein